MYGQFGEHLQQTPELIGITAVVLRILPVLLCIGRSGIQYTDQGGKFSAGF